MKKYNLECFNNVKEDLLYWIKLYLYQQSFKLTKRMVENKNEAILLDSINQIPYCKDIESLRVIANTFNRINFNIFYSYFFVLKELYKFIYVKNISSIKEINDEILIEFLSFKSNYSNATKQTFRKRLIHFFRFISKYNSQSYLFDININVSSITLSNSKLPRYLPKESLMKLIRYVKSIKMDNFYNAREALILKIFVLSGIRKCELRFLEMKNITLLNDSYIIEVLGKCNKYRKVCIAKEAIKQELESYLYFRDKVRKPLTREDKDYLFINTKHNQMSDTQIYAIVKNVLKKNNLLARFKNGTHLLRHSYATFLYQQSKDILLLQQLLGHSSIETTKIYTHLNNEAIIESSKYLKEICV